MLLKHSILKNRLIIFTGKGGAGKSVISIASAILASKLGRRTIIVEFDQRKTIPGFFSISSPDYQEILLTDGVSYINIDPTLALKEYILMKFKYSRLYEVLTSSRIYKVFTRAAPGLRELVSIGKVWWLSQQMDGGRPKYDIIILDAPQTGQIIPFLRVPSVAIEALRIGPVVRDSIKLKDMLSQRTTSIYIATIPEELSVNETIETWRKIEDSLDIPMGGVVINKVMSERLSLLERRGMNELRRSIGQRATSAVIRSMEFYEKRKKNQRMEIKRLKSSLSGVKVEELPFIHSNSFGRSELERLALFIDRNA